MGCACGALRPAKTVDVVFVCAVFQIFNYRMSFSSSSSSSSVFFMFTYCAQHEYNQIVKKRSNLFIEDKTKQKETSTLRCRRIIRNDSICSLAIDFPLTR